MNMGCKMDLNIFLFMFFNTKEDWDMCQILYHEIKPMVNIEQSYVTFPSIKFIMESRSQTT
jgi:hypothetical protein